MKVRYHKEFEKEFSKLTAKAKTQVKKTIDIFIDDPLNPKLRNHPLKGNFTPQRSISAGGDLRLHYLETDDGVLFVVVGTHSQLYK